MAAGVRYSLICSSKWEDEWYLMLKPQVRNLFDWFVENSANTVAGVYQCDLDVPYRKTRPWRSVSEFRAICRETLAGHINLYPGNWVWVVNYVKHNCRNGVSRPLALGMVSVLLAVPVDVRAHWWEKYSTIMEAVDIKRDSLAIPYLYPTEYPSRTVPNRTVPEGGTEGTSLREVNAQSALKGTRKSSITTTQGIAIRQCCEAFIAGLQKSTGMEHPPFPLKRAEGFLASRFRLKHPDDPDAILDLIRDYFSPQAEGGFRRANSVGSWGHFQAQYGLLGQRRGERLEASDA